MNQVTIDTCAPERIALFVTSGWRLPSGRRLGMSVVDLHP